MLCRHGSKIVLIFVAIKNKLALSEVTMRKIAFVLSLMLLIHTNAWAEENINDSILIKVRQETENYKKECYEKEAFPKGIDNYNMYNDDIKEGNFRYHQCLKKIIIKKIQRISSPEDAEKMVADLDKIQEGISDYYWILYNRQDNGVIGRMQNDVILGRRFEDILEDILYYEALYDN